MVYAELLGDDDPRFFQFWSIYPRKVAKGQARVAFRQAIKKVDFETLMQGVRDYPFNQQRHLVPFPATWLNGERWIPEVWTKPITVERLSSRSRSSWRDAYDGGPPTKGDDCPQ